MDLSTNTDNFLMNEIKSNNQNILLEFIKELCYSTSDKLSVNLKGKINRIIADCDLSHYTSLHKLSTADETTSHLLGFLNQTSVELSFDEQTELNKAIINKIQTKLPCYTIELDKLQQTIDNKKCRNNQIQELQHNLDDKINILQNQEKEKADLMMEWLNHRLQDVVKFNDNSTELLTLKSKILDLKSKILHLQILQNIFTETNQSIKAYVEVHQDLKDTIKNTEQKIKDYRAIIESDY